MMRLKSALKSKHAAFVSDSVTNDKLLPGFKYPMVPGHEVAGLIDKVGSRSMSGKLDSESPWVDTVTIVVTEFCTRGDFVSCQLVQVLGISYNGGYADYMIDQQKHLRLSPMSFQLQKLWSGYILK